MTEAEEQGWLQLEICIARKMQAHSAKSEQKLGSGLAERACIFWPMHIVQPGPKATTVHHGPTRPVM